MSRIRVSTTVDEQLLTDARRASGGQPDSVLLDAALRSFSRVIAPRSSTRVVEGHRALKAVATPAVPRREEATACALRTRRVVDGRCSVTQRKDTEAFWIAGCLESALKVDIAVDRVDTVLSTICASFGTGDHDAA
jgi:hypothetical protein